MIIRYIIIDRHSGFIWGDSAVFAVGERDLTPLDAARLLDQSLWSGPYEYIETVQHDAAALYDVYLADATFPVVSDGQDQATIDAVERDCEYVASIIRN